MPLPKAGVPVCAIALAATPAAAQVDLNAAEKLANGNVAYVLAVACVGLVAVTVYLFKALMDAQRAHHAETVETLTSVVTLSNKLNEGLELVEKAIDHVTKEQRR